jgi:hypothetical protein
MKASGSTLWREWIGLNWVTDVLKKAVLPDGSGFQGEAVTRAQAEALIPPEGLAIGAHGFLLLTASSCYDTGEWLGKSALLKKYVKPKTTATTKALAGKAVGILRLPRLKLAKAVSADSMSDLDQQLQPHGFICIEGELVPFRDPVDLGPAPMSMQPLYPNSVIVKGGRYWDALKGIVADHTAVFHQVIADLKQRNKAIWQANQEKNKKKRYCLKCWHPRAHISAVSQ